jgi:hypothetical protein
VGVSYLHGDRSTGGSRTRLPLDPKMGECAECGEERQVLTTPIGDMYAPLEGTLWDVHPGGLTCSPLCRAWGGHPPGPFDNA